MKILVIPDVHLKPWMFERASEIMKSEDIDKAICLMDIPDDWNQETNLELYENTFDRAIEFQRSHPETLWCYGNHDLSYIWLQQESGFSYYAIDTVREKMEQLQKAMKKSEQVQYIHKVDKVLFSHGGLTKLFVKCYAKDVDYENADEVIKAINKLGCEEMWLDGSPIWARPQYDIEQMYNQDNYLQVVGHTPVEKIMMEWNLLSCDVFSTYPTGDAYGTQEFLIIDTETWEYYGKM